MSKKQPYGPFYLAALVVVASSVGLGASSCEDGKKKTPGPKSTCTIQLAREGKCPIQSVWQSAPANASK